MGAEFSSSGGACDGVIVSQSHAVGTTEQLLSADIDGQIEYQLKSYLNAKDDGYECLIPSGVTSIFDIKLIQRLIAKNRYTQCFAYRLLHRIFADRFKLPCYDPFSTVSRAAQHAPAAHCTQNSSSNYHSSKTLKLCERVSSNMTSVDGEQDNSNALLVRPKTKRQLIASVDSAIHFGHTINVVGNSSVPSASADKAKVLHIDMRQLTAAPLDMDAATLNEYGRKLLTANNLLVCAAGATPDGLHSFLWPVSSRDKLGDDSCGAFKMLSSSVYDDEFAGHTVYDIVSNGLQSAFGTPFSNHSLLHSVRSVQMVIVDRTAAKHNKEVLYSRVVQIEPDCDDGAVHDAQQWALEYPHIELIQSSQMFAACLCGTGGGVVGVVYAYHLELSDAFFVRKSVHLIDWDAFKQTKWRKIENECRAGKMVGLSLAISPYATLDKRFMRSPPMLVTMYRRSSRRHEAKDGKNAAEVSADGAMLVWLSVMMPELIPFVLQMMLQRQCVPRSRCAHGDEGHHAWQTSSAEIAVDAACFVDAIDQYINTCRQLKKHKRKQFVTAPLMVKFGGKSRNAVPNANAHFEQNAFLKQCMFNFSTPKVSTPHLLQTLNEIETDLVGKLNAVRNVRDAQSDHDHLQRIWQSMESDKKALFSASNIFCNAFSAKLDLSESDAQKKVKRIPKKRNKANKIPKTDPIVFATKMLSL